MKTIVEEIKQSPTTLLLNVLIHDRRMTPTTRKLIEKELKERGALL